MASRGPNYKFEPTAPGNWYNYNRYGYCLNNPLMYNDPSGEIIGFLLAIWAGNYLINSVAYAINNNTSLKTAFKATPIVGGVGFSPTGFVTGQSNMGFSHPQLDAHLAVKNEIRVSRELDNFIAANRMGESITSGNLAYQNAMVSEGIRNSVSMLPAQGGRGIEGDRFEANVWFGLGLGFDVSFFGLGGKVQANGPNVNLFNFVNGEYSTWNGVRWFNAKGGLALANLESEAFYDGKDVSMNTKLQLAATEFSTQKGVRFAPIKISYHYYIIGGDISVSRHFLRAPFEYEKARQEFYENTGTPMFRR